MELSGRRGGGQGKRLAELRAGGTKMGQNAFNFLIIVPRRHGGAKSLIRGNAPARVRLPGAGGVCGGFPVVFWGKYAVCMHKVGPWAGRGRRAWRAPTEGE